MSDLIMPTKQFCTNDKYSTTLFILGPLLLPGNTSSRNPARLLGLKNEYMIDKNFLNNLWEVYCFDLLEVLRKYKIKVRGE